VGEIVDRGSACALFMRRRTTAVFARRLRAPDQYEPPRRKRESDRCPSRSGSRLRGRVLALDPSAALAVRGLIAVPSSDPGCCLINVRYAHEDAGRLMTDLAPAVEDWLTDRGVSTATIRSGERSQTIRARDPSKGVKMRNATGDPVRPRPSLVAGRGPLHGGGAMRDEQVGQGADVESYIEGRTR